MLVKSVLKGRQTRKVVIGASIVLGFFVIGSGYVIRYSITNPTSLASIAAPADLNNDEVVDISDVSLLITRWGTNDSICDIDKNGTVNISDLSVVISNWGTVATSEQPLWKQDFESGGFSGFGQNDPHNLQPSSYTSSPQPWATRGAVPSNTVSPAGNGNYIGKYFIPGTTLSFNPRSESILNSSYDFAKGQDKWFSFRTYLGSDIPDSTTGWQVISQWKNNGYGSPPVSISINGGKFKLEGGYGYPGSTTDPNYVFDNRQFSQDIATATKGVWHKFKIHIYFDDDPSKGYVEVWYNDQPVTMNPYVQPPYTKVVSGSKFYPPGGTLYPGLFSYLKLGLYRDKAITTNGSIYFDDYKLGNSQASVK